MKDVTKKQARSRAVAVGDWYDYPQYYDLAFAEDTKIEADFFEAAAAKFAVGPIRRVLEPGCGGGRLVLEMASRGYHAVGFDDNRCAISYLAKKIARRKLRAEAKLGDMTDFRLARPVDLAFNTFNTFRHLTTEETALRHLRCMAKAVRPGGLFVLGFHLLPPDASEECIERWKAVRGKTQVSFTLRVLECDRRLGQEWLRVSMLVRRPRQELRLATEFPLRIYTVDRVQKLFRAVPEWELCETYDFVYDIDHPLALNDDLADAVFVLRRREDRA
jgi:SAM-dependent methyltransferase